MTYVYFNTKYDIMRNMKLIVILGQTATGKSDFAVQVAKETGGEIISADSRQIYKGMDLGTGKITKKEMKKVPHHLLDVVSPKKIFSVNDFQKIAHKKIKEIFKRNNVPIICGGTGFYIDSVINETIFPDVKPNKELREKLSKKTPEQLFEMLKKLDKDRAKNIDPKNSVRLTRAIEIAKTLGKVPKLKTNMDTNSAMAKFVSESKSSVLKIGLTLPPEILKERIKIRLLSRIKKGMIREVENLHKNGVSWKRMHSFGLEYRYVSLFLQKIKNLSSPRLRQAKEEMIEKLNTEIWHFAKRQNTWFKRDPSIIWINPLKESDKTHALQKIKKFLK